MKYEKLTLKAFTERLNNDGYKNAGGARKSVGKASEWSAEEKEKAMKLINKHFGEEAAPAPKNKAKKKAPVKKAAAKVEKVSDAPPKKRGRKPKAKAETVPPVQEGLVSNKGSTNVSLTAADVVSIRVGTICQAIEALDKAKKHGIDVKEGMERSTSLLMAALEDFGGTRPANGSSKALQKFLAAAPKEVPPPAEEDDSVDLDTVLGSS